MENIRGNKVLRSSALALLVVALVGCSEQTAGVSNTSTVEQSTSSISESSSSESSGAVKRDEKILDGLKEQGILSGNLDINDKKTTDDGLNIIGGALPTEKYKSLHDCESAYGKYLGLHNDIESMPDFELVDIYIVDKQFMQAIYDIKTDLVTADKPARTITVKLSTSKKSSELIEVYNKLDDVEKKQVGSVEVTVSKRSSSENEASKVVIINFDCKNGKAYSIYCESGLTDEEALKITKELIGNLEIMEDWEA